MKKHMLLLLCAVITLVAPSCHKISGEGAVVTRTFSIKDFSGIYAGIDGDIYFTQDSVYKVEILAQQNIQELIQTYVDGGVLQLQFEKFKNVGNHSRITVYVSAPSIHDLGVNGSGYLRVLQPVMSSALHLKVNGSGDVYVSQFNGANLTGTISGSGNINVGSGSASTETLQISGSGGIDMLNLSARSVNVRISGSGNAKVNATDNLDVNISGSGDVYYLGSPSLHTSISGSGKVRPY